MSIDEAQGKLASAARYRKMAQSTQDRSTRVALIETAREFERLASRPHTIQPYAVTMQDEELTYLAARHDQEMAAAADASNRLAQLAHLELAFRYAVRAAAMRAQ